MIGFSVDQVNAFTDTICASFLIPGSITALYYSNRLVQLPLALFGIALATVALPVMSASVSKNDIAGMKQTLNYSLRMACFTLIPSTCGLIAIGIPVIQVLFERGKFTPDWRRRIGLSYCHIFLGKCLFTVFINKKKNR